MTTDLAACRRRLQALEAEIAAMPRYFSGSPRHTDLVNRARRLSEHIEQVKLHRRWIVPEGEGPLSRFRIEIPRPAAS